MMQNYQNKKEIKSWSLIKLEVMKHENDQNIKSS